MLTTQALKDEFGQFVVIPEEIAFVDIDMDLDITRCGDVITIRPATAAPVSKPVASEGPIPGEAKFSIRLV